MRYQTLPEVCLQKSLPSKTVPIESKLEAKNVDVGQFDYHGSEEDVLGSFVEHVLFMEINIIGILQ